TPSLLSAVADGAALIDGVTTRPIAAQIGVVARATTTNFALSMTGVAAPGGDGTFAAGNSIHDIWVVAQADLDFFNNALVGDPELAAYLPIGPEGGTVGLVRDEAGVPVAGATVTSAAGQSLAQIRYIGANGASDVATDSVGL